MRNFIFFFAFILLSGFTARAQEFTLQLITSKVKKQGQPLY
jgi:hypothetical protein